MVPHEEHVNSSELFEQIIRDLLYNVGPSLTVVKGCAEYLLQHPDAPEQQELLNLIHLNAERLIELWLKKQAEFLALEQARGNTST